MTYHKALLIPINSKRQIFIQDRRGFKAPDWGFFGGSIEAGESAIEAVIREAGEELLLELIPEDLIHLGAFPTEYQGDTFEREFYLYKTDQVEFDVREGRGGVWLSAEEASARMLHAEYFDQLWAAIEKVVA